MAESAQEPSDSASAESARTSFLDRVRRGRDGRPNLGTFIDVQLRFPDGTIILKAENTVFRVYKGPLVRHSPVFRDMLDSQLPQPQTEETVSGTITVTLYDSAYDVRCLLEVLMPRHRLRLSDHYDASFDEVCACLRMAHKYQIDELIEESLRSLRKFYPDTYALFKDRRDKQPPNPARAVSVVNLARLVEAPNLLPMALVECCTLGSEIVNGYKRPDFTEEHLGLFDIGLCFQAKDRLIEARVLAFQRMFEPRIRRGCTAPDADNEAFDSFYFDVTDGAVPGLYTPNVWHPFTDYLSTYLVGICQSCKQAFIAEDAAQQKHMFDQLPALLGITVNGWGTPPRRRWHPFAGSVIMRPCGDQCRGHT